MSDGVYSTGDGLATAGLDAVIIGLGGTLAVAAEPSGAGALAFAYVTPVAIMNIRSWGPFQEADNGWTALSGTFGDLANELEDLLGEVDPYWQGAGSEAFKNFITTKAVGPLEVLQEVCEQAAAGCNGVADALEETFWVWVAGTTAAIIACVAANAAGPASPGAKWAAIGTWVAFVTGCLLAIIMLMQGTRGAASALGTAMEELKRGFELEGDKVQAGSAHLADDQRDLIVNPENWNKEVQA